VSKPDEILVTDFFGGVASVEVISASKALSPIGRKFGAWKESTKGLESVKPVTSLSHAHSRRLGTTKGWSRPLVQQKDGVDGIKTGVTLGCVLLACAVVVRTQMNMGGQGGKVE